jgi:hypothetical protein
MQQNPAALIASLSQEVEDTRVHIDAIVADTRKWESLTRTIQDVCELSAKLKRDRSLLVEELAVKRQTVQRELNQREAMVSELRSIEGTIGSVGKYVK